MARIRLTEILVGAFMVLGFVALFFLAMRVSNLSLATAEDGYSLTAKFDNIGSLRVRAPVTMAGVRVGRVAAIGFDQETYQAVVTLRIAEQYDQIPTDTFANIFTAGLLGEQYIGLDPGASPDMLSNGDRIEFTQSALVLEQMIGQFLLSKAEEGGK
ncbi:outer membrane lipid asymmetry maintenance protein MlaD [Halochromatium glycolicum]|jgi:phospholipid/cholesterol/gamma-HCH transport system substrate-binding protein|uniref:Outer membrane lipid asymmetry maintenance protein MlaD n=1 Tax=Halochromatium glycolicum TaxID=85075 RepID=A0AAJ0U410_9GAMM|nr:outer membrane lipid asymmetry maintenance protein MlaD [Halochromatium glycolicum]MBK1704821.1 outer membrane lipid asymmetry maintenance protein MlaD [Halochromatium glycolicum]NBC48173.1 outer membrane lipid asymmetry maintenance protein MlaD [Gammaproteobacteria bacterium]